MLSHQENLNHEIDRLNNAAPIVDEASLRKEYETAML
jgi:hypothetical protein